jgi:hypothetical protein
MSDVATFVELDGLHVELLPARTVLSLLSVVDPGGPGGPTGPEKSCYDTPGKHDYPCKLPFGEGPRPPPRGSYQLV